jgi:hypothetical protein
MSAADRHARRRMVASHVAGGLTVPQAAALFDLSDSTVYEACREFRVHATRRQFVKASTYDILARLLNTTDAISVIARDFHLTPQRIDSIRSFAVKAGIRMPHRGFGESSGEASAS